jgi:serralysin
MGGADTIAGGTGNDTLVVDFSAALGAVSVNGLAGTAAAGYAGNITGIGITTFAGIENFEITSGTLNDVLTLGTGNDFVDAGDGNDTIYGNGGNDTLKGGRGFDTFIFKDGFGTDKITDFSTHRKEKIDLSDVREITDFKDLTDNHLSSDTIGNAIITDGNDTITLTGVDFSNLQSNDFIF